MLCAFCNQAGMMVKHDKKGRPFLQCGMCSTRAFTRTSMNVQAYEENMAFLANKAALERSADFGKMVAGVILEKQQREEQQEAQRKADLQEAQNVFAKTTKTLREGR